MKYIIRFQKTGVICYTSHLDIMKVFKRSFKRAGIRLAYSQGFNPHPKMGFAQPLSLGYIGYDEYIEFETAAEYDQMSGQEILDALKAIMPDGLSLVSIEAVPEMKKTLAAMTEAADYEIRIPFTATGHENSQTLLNEYMGQSRIMALKKQKKKKEPVSVDIKPKIREIAFALEEKELVISAQLDAGSDSNLSPELLVETVKNTFSLECDRSEIAISRLRIHFK